MVNCLNKQLAEEGEKSLQNSGVPVQILISFEEGRARGGLHFVRKYDTDVMNI